MATTSKLTGMLKKAAANWDETVTDAKAGGFEEYEDGKYPMQFIGYEIKESQGTPKNPSHWGISQQWMFLEGDYVDKIKYRWVQIFDKDDPNRISSFLVRDLEKMTATDADELDPTAIEQMCEDSLNQVWMIQLKTGTTGYQNFYMNTQLDEADYTKDEKKPAKKGAAPSPGNNSGTKAVAKKKKRECPVEVGDLVNITSGEHEGTTEVEITEIDEEAETVSFEISKKVRGKNVSETISVDYDEVENIETDPGEAPFDEGAEVSWSVTTGKGKAAKTEEFTGTIVDCYVDEESGEWCANVDTGETETKGVGKNKKEVPITVIVACDDLTIVEDAEEETEEENDSDDVNYEVGQEISFSEGDETLTGEITEIDTDEETLTVKVKVGKRFKSYEVSFDDIASEDEDEEEEEEEETAADDVEDDPDIDPEVGMSVEFTDPATNTKVQGNVIGVNAKTRVAKVKVGTKTYPAVDYDELVLLKKKES